MEEEVVYKVYVIVNSINGKMYVGYTERPLDKRYAGHLRSCAGGSKASIHDAMRKYGIENFSIRMIEEYKTKQDMIKGEIEWIAYFDTYKTVHGYNDTIGGEGGDTLSGQPHSDEWRNNLSKSMAGRPLKSRRRFSEEVELEICRLYIENNKSRYALGIQFDCQKSLIYEILCRHEIPIRQSNYTGHSNNRNIFTKEQEKDICDEYLGGKVSRSELSRKYKCGKTTIRDVLLRNDVNLSRS